MKRPTTELRWFRFDMNGYQGEHPSATIIEGTSWAIVLQQFWESDSEGEFDEWRDIPMAFQ